VWNAGFRYGWILTAPHGPGFLRGQLEYAIDAVPVFLVMQRSGTAYGGGFNPFAFKWILAPGKQVRPYFEIGGGTLFTNVKVPENTSRVNFTTSGALGLHFLQEILLERGSAVHAHFQRGHQHAESGNQHHPGAHRLWPLHPAQAQER
jgi:hypothetical protein